MDPVMLAKEIATYLTPFLPYLVEAGKRAGDKATEQAGEALGTGAWERAKSIWAKLHPKVEAKPAAKEAINDAAGSPQDSDVQATLRLQLRKLFQEDQSFAAELMKWLDGVKASGVTNVQGDRNVVGDISGGTVITGDIHTYK